MYTEWKEDNDSYQSCDLLVREDTDPILKLVIERFGQVWRPRVVTGDGRYALWYGDCQDEIDAKKSAKKSARDILFNFVKNL